MKIIIEGPDGAGKTTLAQTLSRMTKYPIIHRSKPESDEERDSMMNGYLVNSQTTDNAIYDRYAYSELVYGTVMRDKSYVSFEQLLQIEDNLAKAGGMVIFCDAPIDLLWNRCLARGEDYITDLRALTAIQDRYRHLMLQMQHRIPVLRHVCL